MENLVTKIKNDVTFENAKRVFPKKKTTVKLLEEMGEFISGVARGDHGNTLEEFCDVLVVMTRLHDQLDNNDKALVNTILNSKLYKLNHIINEESRHI